MRADLGYFESYYYYWDNFHRSIPGRRDAIQKTKELLSVLLLA